MYIKAMKVFEAEKNYVRKNGDIINFQLHIYDEDPFRTVNINSDFP